MIDWLRDLLDLPDVFALTGVALLIYGGEQLSPGVGLVAGGAVLVYIGLFYQP